MWVWDSSTYAATSRDEGGPISTYRWEPDASDFTPAPADGAPLAEFVAYIAAYAILAGLFALMYFGLPIG